MKVVAISSFGEPDVLKVVDREKPSILPTEVLIEVKAAGINRPDTFQRKGNYPAPEGVAADIPGLEVAGYVIEVGEEVEGLRKGDRVMALLAGGGYAQFVNVDAGSCLLVPDTISLEEAAGIPETLFTVWHNVFQRGNLKSGEKLLVHGGTGGIGLTAIQLAQAFGADVYTTVGSEVKKDFVEHILGVCKAFNYHQEDFEAVLREEKVNVILDSIGGEYFSKNINVLSDEGRLVQINAMKGAKVEVNLFKIMQKRLFLTGSTLRSRSLEFKSALAKELNTEVLPLIAEGKLKTYIAQVFPYTEVVEAHRLMESRDFIGKIILTF